MHNFSAQKLQVIIINHNLNVLPPNSSRLGGGGHIKLKKMLALNQIDNPDYNNLINNQINKTNQGPLNKQ